MTRANNRLSALAMKTAPPSQMADGRGLIFDKGATSAKWLYRYSYGGKRREMGLRLAAPTEAGADEVRWQSRRPSSYQR